LRTAHDQHRQTRVGEGTVPRRRPRMVTSGRRPAIPLRDAWRVWSSRLPTRRRLLVVRRPEFVRRWRCSSLQQRQQIDARFVALFAPLHGGAHLSQVRDGRPAARNCASGPCAGSNAKVATSQWRRRTRWPDSPAPRGEAAEKLPRSSTPARALGSGFSAYRAFQRWYRAFRLCAAGSCGGSAQCRHSTAVQPNTERPVGLREPTSPGWVEPRASTRRPIQIWRRAPAGVPFETPKS